MEKSKKHICMLAYTFYEADNRVRRYAEALASHGNTVEAYVLQNNYISNTSKSYSLNNVKVIGIQKRFLNEKSKFTYLSRIVSFLIKVSARLIIAHIKKPYHVIHVHSIPDFAVFSAIIPKLFGAKVILDIHDIVPELFLTKFNLTENSTLFRALLLIEKLSTRFADHVIVANDIWKKKLIDRSVKEEKCTVFMNYPDTNIFYPKPRIRKDNRFILMYPGTLSKHQGINVAIHAFDKIKDKIPEAEFHIFGTGTDKSLLSKLIIKLDLTSHVFLKGAYPLEKIAEKIAEADLCIEPKLNMGFADEAFSTKIFEFMAMGIPVIASDTSVHRYYLNPQVIRFFKSGDENDLASAILDLYRNISKRKELIRNSYKFIKSYNWNFHKERYFKIIERL